MSAQEQIIDLVPILSDKDAEIILTVIKRFCPSVPETAVSEKRRTFEELDKEINAMFSPEDFDPDKKAAFDRLEKLIEEDEPYPTGFDYKKELMEALDEKYGRVN